MQKLVIIMVGDMKTTPYRELFAEYRKRLGVWYDVEVLVVPCEKMSKGVSVQQVRRAEAVRVGVALDKISVPRYVVLLTEFGVVPKSSVDMSRWLAGMYDRGEKLVCVIGGPAGLDVDVLSGFVDYEMALSPLTYLHEASAVLLMEQVYRGRCIAVGKKYHL